MSNGRMKSVKCNDAVQPLISSVISTDNVLPPVLLEPLMKCEHVANTDSSSYWLDVRANDPANDPDCRYFLARKLLDQ